VLAAAVASMRSLNRAAADALRALPPGVVHSCTDITGFGLLGHASEMANASGTTLTVSAHELPLLPGVEALVAKNRPGGLASNRQHFGPAVKVASGVDQALLSLMFDPQTSGGLLVSVDAYGADLAAHAFAEAGVEAARVGVVGAREGAVAVKVTP
jgi:selenide,water dikinase